MGIRACADSTTVRIFTLKSYRTYNCVGVGGGGGPDSFMGGSSDDRGVIIHCTSWGHSRGHVMRFKGGPKLYHALRRADLLHAGAGIPCVYFLGQWMPPSSACDEAMSYCLVATAVVAIISLIAISKTNLGRAREMKARNWAGAKVLVIAAGIPVVVAQSFVGAVHTFRSPAVPGIMAQVVVACAATYILYGLIVIGWCLPR